MEQNELFRPVFFWILHPEAIQSLSLNPKNFGLGIPNPKLKLFVNNRNITERSAPFHSIPFRVLATALSDTVILKILALFSA